MDVLGGSRSGTYDLAYFLANDYGDPTFEMDYMNNGVSAYVDNSTGFSYNSWINVTTFLHQSLADNGHILCWVNGALEFNITMSKNSNLVNNFLIMSDDGNVGSYIDDVSLSYVPGTAETVISVSVSPTTDTVYSGQSVTYSATAYDNQGNSFDVTSDPGTTWSISSAAGGSWTGNVYTSQFPSAINNPWTVSCNYQGVTNTSQLAVKLKNPIYENFENPNWQTNNDWTVWSGDAWRESSIVYAGSYSGQINETSGGYDTISGDNTPYLMYNSINYLNYNQYSAGLSFYVYFPASAFPNSSDFAGYPYDAPGMYGIYHEGGSPEFLASVGGVRVNFALYAQKVWLSGGNFGEGIDDGISCSIPADQWIHVTVLLNYTYPSVYVGGSYGWTGNGSVSVWVNNAEIYNNAQQTTYVTTVVPQPVTYFTFWSSLMSDRVITAFLDNIQMVIVRDLQINAVVITNRAVLPSIYDENNGTGWLITETEFYHLQINLSLAGVMPDVTEAMFTDAAGAQVVVAYDFVAGQAELLSSDTYARIEVNATVTSILGAQNQDQIQVDIWFWLKRPLTDTWGVSLYASANDTVGDETGWEDMHDNYFNIYSLGGLTTQLSNTGASTLYGNVGSWQLEGHLTLGRQ